MSHTTEEKQEMVPKEPGHLFDPGGRVTGWKRRQEALEPMEAALPRTDYIRYLNEEQYLIIKEALST